MGTASDTETIRFPVHGMTCASCVNRITRSLKRLDGVSAIRIDLRRETATLTRRRGDVPDEAIASRVAAAGYSADLQAVETLPTSTRPGILARLLGRDPGDA